VDAYARAAAYPVLTTHRQAPEVQTMYSLNLPVSALRTKMRQEFERHRYVNQIKTVDVLLFNSHQEYQVRSDMTMFKPRANVVSGNPQLLEADITRAQVLPRRGGAQGEAPQQLHQRLPRGSKLIVSHVDVAAIQNKDKRVNSRVNTISFSVRLSKLCYP
jgi:hypothetical protein